MRARRILVAAGVALAAAAVTGILAAFLVPLPDRVRAPGATLVLWDDGQVAQAMLAPDGRLRVPARLEEVDPDYVDALVAIEDHRFWWHPGFDPLALARALAQRVTHGEVISGGSTLTMQVARMAEPRPRTMRSKVLEMLRAVQLELRLDKRQILEAYLTLAPYGRNLEGIEAASLACFGHRPDQLTDDEIAVLLAIPQDPTDRYPTPAHEPALRAARDRVVLRLAAAGRLDLGGDHDRAVQDVVADLVSHPVPTALAPLPRAAPHATRWLAGRHPGADRVPTTLDRGVQGAAERALARFSPEARELGIHNAVVVVVEHEDGAVRGLVGNMDFWDAEHGGQIPAFDVPRSPGSTLKPFVYGRAIDAGLELPEHLVPDVPVSWGTWSPDNYDGGFSGMVRLEDALSRSLNVPFVVLLDEIGVEPFLGVLRQSGVKSLAPEPGHYGLSLVAGGIELTPLELAGLYTSVAEDGVPRELRFAPDAPVRRLTPTMSPGTAWLVRRALTRRDRPDFPSGQGGAEPHHVHWKTGTSYGHRDAWAVGSGERYTVAVWLGNMDNSASVRLVGAAAAGPVLFDVMDALGDRGPERDDPPPDLEPVEVCALSGELPGAACTHRVHALAPRAATPTHRCEVHAEIEVDLDTGERVLPGCRAGRRTEVRPAVVWSAEVRRYLDDPGEPLPRLADGCAELGRTDRPRIVEPRPDLVKVLVPGMPADEQEVALEADAPPGPLDWFVDGRHLGRAPADEVVWWTPSAGKHLVVVQDRAGNTDRQWIEVRSL